MMDIARNPSRLQELTRSMDRQMQNLESLPGIRIIYRNNNISNISVVIQLSETINTISGVLVKRTCTLKKF